MKQRILPFPAFCPIESCRKMSKIKKAKSTLICAFGFSEKGKHLSVVSVSLCLKGPHDFSPTTKSEVKSKSRPSSKEVPAQD